MTARIFAYIAHTDGVPDDYAAELLAAAKNSIPMRRRLPSSPARERSLIPLVTICGQAMRRSGRSGAKAWPIRMPNSFGRRW